MAAACYSAALPDKSEERTLGIIQTGAGVAATGLSTAGKLAAAAIGVVSAVKPLIMLGVGKCKCQPFCEISDDTFMFVSCKFPKKLFMNDCPS